MAKRITRSDALRVHSALIAMLGEDYGSDAPWRYLTRDNWSVSLGGWHHAEGWSRGFTVGDNLGTIHTKHRGYHSARHDHGRYEGVGWHERMALDVVDAIEGLRAAVESGGRKA